MLLFSYYPRLLLIVFGFFFRRSLLFAVIMFRLVLPCYYVVSNCKQKKKPEKTFCNLLQIQFTKDFLLLSFVVHVMFTARLSFVETVFELKLRRVICILSALYSKSSHVFVFSSSGNFLWECCCWKHQ